MTVPNLNDPEYHKPASGFAAPLPRGNGLYRCVVSDLSQHSDGLETYFFEIEIIEVVARDPAEDVKQIPGYTDRDGNEVPARPYGKPLEGQTYSIKFALNSEDAVVRRLNRTELVRFLAACYGHDLSDGENKFDANKRFAQLLKQANAGEPELLFVEIKAIDKPGKKDPNKLYTNLYYNPWAPPEVD